MTIPSLNRQIELASVKGVPSFVALDFTRVQRLETAASQFFESKTRALVAGKTRTVIVLGGVSSGSGLEADLDRGGVKCRRLVDRLFDDGRGSLRENSNPHELMTFDTLREAFHWCRVRAQSM